MPRDRWFFLPVGALILACGGALSAAPSPPSSASAAPSSASAAPSAASPLGLSWQGEPVHLKAGRLKVDLAARQATLEEHVTLRRAAATLRCPRVELRFDAQGQVTWAQGSGGVTVDDRDLHAEAAEVSFDLEKRSMILRGSVRVQKAGARLTAASATVDLVHQQIELTDVEGAVASPASSAR